MMTWPTSLRRRFLLLTLLLLTVVWLLTAWITWRDARHELNELLDSHLAQAAALLVVQQSREASEGYHHEQMNTPSLHRYTPQVVFQVWHDGELGMRSTQAPLTPLSNLKQGFETRQIDGVAWRVFAAQGAEHDVQVYVGEQVRSREHIALAVLRSTLWPLALALPMLALGLWWITRRSLHPLDTLSRDLSQRAPHTLTPIELADAPDEIRTVQDALNDLLGRIGRALDNERRFTADAAHELRTPLAAIRAQAQVALSSDDLTGQHEAMLNVMKGCDRATHAVEQMLQLARLDSVGEQTATSTIDGQFDLVACAQELADNLADTVASREQQLVLELPPTCPITGSASRWRMLMRNLLDNAARHSPRGSTIRLSVRREGSDAVLQVEDSGPGMSEADRQRLGDRFFRVTGTQASGTGLGWSIVKRIASIEHAQIAVETSALGGLSVRITHRIGGGAARA